jgi:protein phosphatase
MKGVAELRPLASRGYAATNIGKVRERNEDALLIDEDLGLYIVADGMGGHAGGKEASSCCVTSVRDSLYQQFAAGCIDRRAAPRRMTGAVEHANREVRKLGKKDKSLRGCGTTVTALQFVDDLAWIAHVGDSRCYHLQDGDLWLLTADHTVCAERVRAGFDRLEDVSEQDHMLMRAVGTDTDIQIDVLRVPVGLRDRFLLCSDGLTLHLSPREIRETMNATQGQATVDAFVGTALDRGGEDNITVVVVEM